MSGADLHAGTGDNKPWGPAFFGAFLVVPSGTPMAMRPTHFRADQDTTVTATWSDRGFGTSTITVHLLAGEYWYERPDIISASSGDLHGYF